MSADDLMAALADESRFVPLVAPKGWSGAQWTGWYAARDAAIALVLSQPSDAGEGLTAEDIVRAAWAFLDPITQQDYVGEKVDVEADDIYRFRSVLRQWDRERSHPPDAGEGLRERNIEQHEAGLHTVYGAWPDCPRCAALSPVKEKE